MSRIRTASSQIKLTTAVPVRIRTLCRGRAQRSSRAPVRFQPKVMAERVGQQLSGAAPAGCDSLPPRASREAVIEAGSQWMDCCCSWNRREALLGSAQTSFDARRTKESTLCMSHLGGCFLAYKAWGGAGEEFPCFSLADWDPEYPSRQNSEVELSSFRVTPGPHRPGVFLSNKLGSPLSRGFRNQAVGSWDWCRWPCWLEAGRRDCE